MVNGRLKEALALINFLMPQPIRCEVPIPKSQGDDEKFSFCKEYKDKPYPFLIIPYPFMSTNPDAKHD
jgi:hypothetical protein